MSLNNLLLLFLILKFSWADFSFPKLEVPKECSKDGSAELFVKILLDNSGIGIQDVGIFDLMDGQDDLADRIHRCIPAANPVLRFSGGSGSQSIAGGYKRKRVGFTLILSDTSDPVSSSNSIKNLVQIFFPPNFSFVFIWKREFGGKIFVRLSTSFQPELFRISGPNLQ
jgi:hypothetical protein